MDNTRPKVMIIGIDGGTWQVFNPVIEHGHMPNLKSLRDNGCHGRLRSTEPPVTPAAWTTMITGVNPGKHKVYGFEQYDPATGRLSFTNSRTVRFETMWSVLSRNGYKVASLNVPQSYPPFAVNGVVVCGYGCPGKDFDYTYPPELKKKIAQKVPDYDMALHWQKGDLQDDDLFIANMAYCKKAFQAILDLVELVTDDYGWDVMLAEIQQMDLIEHHIYGYLTPAQWQKRPDRAEQVLDMLDCLDEVIGKLAAKASGENDIVMIASDHGLGPFKGKVRPNAILKKWGYLKQQGPLKRQVIRLKKNILRVLGRKMSKGRGTETIFEKLSMDMSRTRAFIAHTAQHAFLYVNVKGRGEYGIVEPGAEYELLVNQLQRKLVDVRNPVSGEKVFAVVQKPQDMFNVGSDQAAEAGDLILAGADGYLPVRSMRGDRIIEPAAGTMGGSHCYDGMYLLSGRKIRSGLNLDANIADIAPTVYGLLAVALPKNLDGKVLHNAFKEPVETKIETHPDADTAGSGKIPAAANLTAQEEQLINRRLADLGYLE